MFHWPMPANGRPRTLGEVLGKGQGHGSTTAYRLVSSQRMAEIQDSGYTISTHYYSSL